MKTAWIITLLWAILMTGSLTAGELYRVKVSSQTDVNILSAINVVPVIPVENGYLVLDQFNRPNLFRGLNIDYEDIASDVEINTLALDFRPEVSRQKNYPVIYGQNSTRILKVDPNDWKLPAESTGIVPIPNEHLEMQYVPVQSIDPSRSISMDSLNNIALKIIPDSLESYIRALEVFPPRVVASEANALARGWLMAKLEDFGYTPVLDTFVYGFTDCHNIMAYHEGVSYPDYYVIIGAHYDAVPGSPGASDDGSGVASVLEIARILKDYETQATFVFALFDAEEVGVVGSSYMADRFASAGDSVIVMLNMDEIAYNAGYSRIVRLFYGTDNSFAQLYVTLADQLMAVNLQGNLLGSSFYSDHFPFQSSGYPVVFALGYPQNPYRHSVRDSAIYVNFAYTARIARGILATALVSDDARTPAPGVVFDYPGRIPEFVSTDSETVFDVRARGVSGGVVEDGSAQLHYSIEGGSFTAVTMTDLGDNLYRATLPEFSCTPGQVQFYVSARESAGETFFDPEPSSPNVATVVSEQVHAYFDDFESDRGWSVFDGLWAIGRPIGQGGEFGTPDPYGGYNSLNCLAYNVNGDYTNNMSLMTVKSPAIDCTGLTNVRLKYKRWLGIGFWGFDNAMVRVSNDGINYTVVWASYAQLSGGYWADEIIDISAVADNQPEVYITFDIGPTNTDWRYCGWNIDNMDVYGYRCDGWVCGDPSGDGDVNLLDILYLIGYLYNQPPGPAPDPVASGDVNNDGNVNLVDILYLIAYRYNTPPGPAPEC